MKQYFIFVLLVIASVTILIIIIEKIHLNDKNPIYKNRFDTVYFYSIYDSTRKCNIIYDSHNIKPKINHTVVYYYSIEKGIMKIDTINN